MRIQFVQTKKIWLVYVSLDGEPYTVIAAYTTKIAAERRGEKILASMPNASVSIEGMKLEIR